MTGMRLSIFALSLSLCLAAPARADFVDLTPGGTVGVGFDGALVIGGIITAIGVTVRPTRGWLIADFVLGGANLLAGTASVAIGGLDVPGGCHSCGIWFGLAAANIAVGIL